MIKHYLIVAAALVLGHSLSAQQTFPVNGPSVKNGKVYAFTHATIHIDHITTLKDATLIIQDDKVLTVAANAAIPANAVITDLAGKHIYPSFIDLYADYGVAKPSRERDQNFSPQLETRKDGPYNWNQSIKPEVNAVELFKANDKAAGDLRKIGFGAVLTHQADGIMRGTGTLVSLGENRDNLIIIDPRASSHVSFQKGSSNQTYPSSLMGSIALLKQTYLDAKWYKTPANRDHVNLSLQSVNDNAMLPQIFEAINKYNILRAAKVGSETGVSYIYKGGGDEYQRIRELKAVSARLIIPIDFPEAYDVTDPYDAQFVGLDDLKHWEWAPANASELEKNGFEFAITTAGLKDKKDFLKNLRKAIKAGLSESAALKALTSTPAAFINNGSKVGALRKGMLANFFISNDDIFEKGNIIENWIQGTPYVYDKLDEKSLEGKYTLKINDVSYPLTITKEGDKLKSIVQLYGTKDGKADTTKADVKIDNTRSLITLSFEPNGAHFNGLVRLSGTIQDNNEWKGKGKLMNGDWVSFVAIPSEKTAAKPDSAKKPTITAKPGAVLYPNMAYGRPELPAAKSMLFKNATVWTNEKEGIVDNADVLIIGGKIARVGKNIPAGTATVVDATGKHLTTGIIDEHSHIAISNGVNEGGQAVSAEVTIEDVVNPDDINIYRQLAGGVTTSQLLHGSANPIGGRSAIIKLKYGYGPEQMKITSADKFIKFALGENVKQSNWGDFNTVRFPQTRMGVEQTMRDAFIRAKEYEASWKTFSAKGGAMPRKDLELETLVEILNGKRFITCHSYVQSEINMLMKVAEEFNFRVNTFTHILEGYKVADKMAKHGAAGSTFGDWWAYKYEVKDAIPYNANLMASQGVLVAINSDDAEMARRLNQEAAKSVKYGGMSEENAWKMVTLNPAKILHLDKNLGSIAVGKDADLVLWNDNPLSIYAKPVKTLIDGAVFFDTEEDLVLRKTMDQERERIIQLMLEAKKSGEVTKKIEPKAKHLYHCDDLELFD
ncbi:MAG: amidohydrolase family protein [Bacteroidota bacterium]